MIQASQSLARQVRLFLLTCINSSGAPSSCAQRVRSLLSAGVVWRPVFFNGEAVPNAVPKSVLDSTYFGLVLLKHHLNQALEVCSCFINGGFYSCQYGIGTRLSLQCTHQNIVIKAAMTTTLSHAIETAQSALIEAQVHFRARHG